MSRRSIIGIFLLFLAMSFPAMLLAEEEETKQEKGTRPHSWEMADLVVIGERLGALKEEDRIGPYQQPRWTTTHQNVTAVYVIPPGIIETLVWIDSEIPRRKEEHSEIRTIYEIEFGLPYRLQLDLYLETLKSGGDSGPLEIAGQSVEIRWALADWGKIWGNPAIYLEYYYATHQRPNEMEAKILLGGEMATGWHWGANLIFEQELGGEKKQEWMAKILVSRTVIDETLSFGVGAMLEMEEDVEEGSEWEAEPMIGPRVRWSPLPTLHLDLVGFFGLNEETPLFRPVFLLAWEF